MRSTLASTSVGMPSDQKLLVKDVHTVEGTANNTSIIDVLKDVGGDITKSIRTTPGAAQRITQLAMDAKKGNLSTATIVSRISSLIGGGKAIDKLAGHVSVGIADTFGMDPMLASKVVTIVKDAAGNPQQVKGRYGAYTDTSSASRITSTIQKFLGNKDVFKELDLGAEAAFAGELINQAVRAGIPSAVDSLLKNASTPENRKYIVTRNIAPILFSGDVATMEAAIKYVAPSTIASLRPKFAQDFLANFRLPYNTTRAEYLSYKNRAIAVLNTIDPNWAYGKRDGLPVLTLEPFVRMSQDAQTVFAMSDDFAVQALAGPSFPSKAIGTLVRSQYPYFPI